MIYFPLEWLTMKNEKDIHSEIEKTMRSLDGLERATPGDYFYTRLQARLEQREEVQHAEPPLAWAIAAVMILILMNVLSVVYYTSSESTIEEIRQEEINALVEEYTLAVPAIYEQNGDE